MSFISAAIIAAGAIGGSLISANASRSAANTQSDAANRASDTQLQMFNQNKADLAPWMQSGQRGNQELMRLLGLGDPSGFDQNAMLVKPFGMADFQTDPGYQFRLQEGTNALLNKRSAMGGLDSGATQKAITQYGQDYASNEYQNAFNRYNQNAQNIYNRLGGISNSGLNAAGSVAGLGANAANNISGLQYAQGQAQAGGILGQNNALMGGAGSLMNQWLQANALQQQGQRADLFNSSMADLNNQAWNNP